MTKAIDRPLKAAQIFFEPDKVEQGKLLSQLYVGAGAGMLVGIVGAMVGAPAIAVGLAAVFVGATVGFFADWVYQRTMNTINGIGRRGRRKQ